MGTIVGTVTGRGQITIPSEIRERLGIKSGDKVAFTLDDEDFRVRRVTYTLESVFDSLPPLPEGVDLEQWIEEATAEAIEDDFPAMRP